MFGSLFNAITDVAKIVVAPVEIAAGVTRAVTKPLAEAAGELVKDVKKLAED